MAERTPERMDELVKLNMQGAKTATMPKGMKPLPVTLTDKAGRGSTKKSTAFKGGGYVKKC